MDGVVGRAVGGVEAYDTHTRGIYMHIDMYVNQKEMLCRCITKAIPHSLIPIDPPSFQCYTQKANAGEGTHGDEANPPGTNSSRFL